MPSAPLTAPTWHAPSPASPQLSCASPDGPTALLIVRNDKPIVLWSSQGVRQGDLIGPLLFFIGYRPTLHPYKPTLDQND